MSPYVYCGGNPILNIDPTGEDYWSTNDPDEIRRFIESQRLLSFSTFENFDYSLWKHSTDAEFVGGLTFNDETNMFHTSFGTIENGEVTIVGVSIKAYDVGDKWASIEGERGRWLQKASERAENVYPEFDLLMGTTKAG